MSDDFNENEFENDEDRERCEKFYKNYLRDKQQVEFVNGYYRWLGEELAEKNYAILPFKYTGMPNTPLCIFRVPSMNNKAFVSILN
jgi:hypothetical protein